jgi:hypothetical protein
MFHSSCKEARGGGCTGNQPAARQKKQRPYQKIMKFPDKAVENLPTPRSAALHGRLSYAYLSPGLPQVLRRGKREGISTRFTMHLAGT